MRVPDAHEDPELAPEDREVVATPREHFDGDHLGTRLVKFTKSWQQEFADFQHCSRSIESRRFENYLADFSDHHVLITLQMFDTFPDACTTSACSISFTRVLRVLLAP